MMKIPIINYVPISVNYNHYRYQLLSGNFGLQSAQIEKIRWRKIDISLAKFEIRELELQNEENWLSNSAVSIL